MVPTSASRVIVVVKNKEFETFSAELICIFISKTCANNYIHAQITKRNYIMDGPSDAKKHKILLFNIVQNTGVFATS